MRKEIEEDIRRWEDVPSSRISRINIIKNSHYFKKYNLQILTQHFTEIERIFFSFIHQKNAKKAKTILNNIGTAGGITIPDLKL